MTFEEKVLDVTTLRPGDRVAQVFYDDLGVPSYTIGRVTSVSPDMHIVQVGEQRYSKDGWRFADKKTRFASRIVELTPQIDQYVRKKMLVDLFASIRWEDEDIVALQALYNVYQTWHKGA